MTSHHVTVVARLAAVTAALLALSGCGIRVQVGLDAGPDGRGSVEAVVSLDRDAAAQVPDLDGELRVDDLRAAGWTVHGPRKVRGGGVRVVARRPFGTPAEAARAVAQLTGPSGPFRGFELTQSRTWLRTTTRLRGNVDLTAGIAAFSEPGLRQRLGGSPFGVDPAVLERQSGTALPAVLHVEVVARLPGAVRSNGADRRRALWQPALGQRVALTAVAHAWNVRLLAPLAVAGGAGLALLAVLARRLARRRPRRLRRRS